MLRQQATPPVVQAGAKCSTFNAGRPLRVALSLRRVACDAGLALRPQGLSIGASLDRRRLVIGDSGLRTAVPSFDCALNSFQCELLQLELDRPLGRTPHGEDTVGDVDRANTGYAPLHCPDLVRRCTGTRHPARHPRLLHFKLLPGGEKQRRAGEVAARLTHLSPVR